MLIASGSEVGIALEAQLQLAADGIGARVVSMPSWHLFSGESEAYRAEVLPPDALRVSIEAGCTMGWKRWVGEGGISVGIDEFGASAPWEQLYERYGITAERVRRAVRGALRERQRPA